MGTGSDCKDAILCLELVTWIFSVALQEAEFFSQYRRDQYVFEVIGDIDNDQKLEAMVLKIDLSDHVLYLNAEQMVWQYRVVKWRERLK